eukprot:m.31522 g.31522  ORF g.31522 m.31522 type:complete len:294 (-) comp6314_c0_seq1:288-1169(-)
MKMKMKMKVMQGVALVVAVSMVVIVINSSVPGPSATMPLAEGGNINAKKMVFSKPVAAAPQKNGFAPRPKFTDGDFDYVDVDFLKRHFDVSLVHEDPPMYAFNNFLTDEEVTAILELATPAFSPSTVRTSRDKTAYRTSSTAWLTPDVTKNNLEYKKVVEQLEQRIADIVQLPVNNQEHFQVLRYNPGEYYKQHSDYIAEQGQYAAGVRALTFYCYLNDVEEGGETSFPNVGFEMKPSPKSCLLWYSTYPHTTDMDARTDHIAKEVMKGQKFGCNKWIHIHDFVTPWARGDGI